MTTQPARACTRRLGLATGLLSALFALLPAARAQLGPAFSRAQIESGETTAPLVPEGHPAETHPLDGPGDVQALAAIYRPPDSPERMILWIGRGGQFRFGMALDGADDPMVGKLLPPRRFRFAGEIFLHAQLSLSGTGALHEDHILRLTPAGTIERVEFEEPAAWFAPQLAPGEGVWKGAAYFFNDDDLRFEFHIWRDGDGNCCPSAGGVTGTMKAVPGGTGWRIVVEKFTREAPVA